MRTLLALACLLAFGCTGNQDNPKRPAMDPTPGEAVHIGSGVYRIVDKDAGVTCWIYDRMGPRSGISCIPNGQLPEPRSRR